MLYINVASHDLLQHTLLGTDMKELLMLVEWAKSAYKHASCPANTFRLDNNIYDASQVRNINNHVIIDV